MSVSSWLARLAIIDENIPCAAGDTCLAVGNKDRGNPCDFLRTNSREIIGSSCALCSITSPAVLIFPCLRSHLSVPFRQQPQRSSLAQLFMSRVLAQKFKLYRETLTKVLNCMFKPFRNSAPHAPHISGTHTKFLFLLLSLLLPLLFFLVVKTERPYDCHPR